MQANDERGRGQTLLVEIPTRLRRRFDATSAEQGVTVEEFVVEALERRLAETSNGGRRSSPRLADASSIRWAQGVLGLTEEETAAIAGMPVERAPTSDGWCDEAGRRARELVDLAERLKQTFEPRSVPVWLSEPNRDPRGRIPRDAIRAGELDRVEAALEVLDSGVFV